MVPSIKTMRCSKCRYWKQDDRYDGGQCCSARQISNGNYAIEDGMFTLCDDDYYGAFLITGPDFYCKKFRNKEGNIIS